jgi:AraC-like DNA-binding protein
MDFFGTPTQHAAVLSLWAEEHGCPVHKLLKDTELGEPDLLKADGFISNRDFEVMIANAFDATGYRGMGLSYGSRLNITSHIALGHAIINCDNFGHVLEIFLKYYRIVAHDVNIRMFDDGQSCKLLVDTQNTLFYPEYFGYEALFSALYSSMRFLLGTQELPFKLELAYAAPGYIDKYYEVLGPQVYFGADQHCLSFASSLKEQLLSTSNPALVALHEKQCQQLLKKLENNDSLSDKIVQLLHQFEGHYPSLEEAADLLATSGRSLRRNLHAEDTSYQLLLDNHRYSQAKLLLRQTQLPLSSIAYRIGYNDMSNFRRAFINWSGRSPSNYRSGG